MKIGIIGAGDVAQTLAKLWIKAGHSVILSSRHPENLINIVQDLGNQAEAATVEEAAAQGDILLLAINYWTVDEALPLIAPHVNGKIIIDATNPLAYGENGGIERVIGENEIAGLIMASKLPNACIVKAFTTLWTGHLQQYAHHNNPKIAVVLAGDALDKPVVIELIKDAGFEPVDLGTLADSQPLDPPSPIWNKALTASEIRNRLALMQQAA